MKCGTIELRDAEIDVLLRRGRLAPESRADLAESNQKRLVFVPRRHVAVTRNEDYAG